MAQDITRADPLEEPEWEDRINNPQDYPFIQNQDGSISTHQMAAEGDAEGNFFVFPMIVQTPTGELKKFEDVGIAKSYALRTGQYKLFKDKDEAIDYSADGYKTQDFINYYDKLMGY